jgi:hypothetical protein
VSDPCLRANNSLIFLSINPLGMWWLLIVCLNSSHMTACPCCISWNDPTTLRLHLAVAELRSWPCFPLRKAVQRQRIWPRLSSPTPQLPGVFLLGKGQGLHPNELSIGGDLIWPLMICPMLWHPRFLFTLNSRTNLLTVVKSWSTWVLTF